MKFSIRILILIIVAISFAKPDIIKSEENLKNQEGNCGIIYGKYHAFSVCAPKGWVLDNRTGVPEGLHAVFYPIGQTWQNSCAVMYVNWALKDEVIKDIKTLVQFNVEKFKSNGSSNSKAEFEKTIKSKEGREGSIWKYSGDKWGNHELVGYFEENKGIALIVLTSKSEADFETAKEAFFELIGSYFFITDDVTYPKN